MAPSTPAAAVERGTTAHQRLVAGTLASLPELARSAGVRPPAVLVVGEVVELAERFGWRGALPLSGVRVLVTRPRGRAGRLSRMLRDAGAEVAEFPCIATEPLTGPLPPLEGAGWVGFTSVTGVEAFFGLLASAGGDVREDGALGGSFRPAPDDRVARTAESCGNPRTPPACRCERSSQGARIRPRAGMAGRSGRVNVVRAPAPRP